MAHLPNSKQPAHPGENPNSAYTLLRKFQAETVPATTAAPASFSTPPTGHTTPPASTAVPTARLGAAASLHHSPQLPTPPTAYTPRLASQSVLTQQSLSPDSITREMIIERIQYLLQDKLPRWSTPTAVLELAKRLTFILIEYGQRGGLGPHGLSKLSDIFMSVGHEGIWHYMALTVNPGMGDVQILLKGELREKEGKDPLHDEELMEMLRDGFDQQAVREWVATLPTDSRAGQVRQY
ncbi:uncharacterized protein K460DRAFT_402437 [Cucurbitaria berberidis CBS 394.84]|uniref:Uncharacterized protein n=1 Tax=Cucurbitaria berberidis CBS 394.84 TaxID=1168544 RepID=A0A9P4L9E1_9PLEO|nr:uncharacterized protein K460DRAFT_402437 [Cucurbitaria berberidis CBS 394.84]KAF1847071.1 hypothetical protein K460DRAFT_402437 [Cucurbitaria berberidis CBS 394.84]